MFNKKFLTVMAALVLGASLFFVGCGDPSDGAAGGPGMNVGYIGGSGDVGAGDLAALFKAADIVTLGPAVPNVAGVVPVGKSLKVSGTTAVKTALSLEVLGTVEVYEGAVLTATGVNLTAGDIYGAAGSVHGAGAVLLPYYADGVTPPEGLLTYNASTAANRTAGSFSTGATPVALTLANVITIFAADDSPETLAVYSLAAITPDQVPAEHTLKLYGPGNTVTASLDLSGTAAGSLVVAEGAVLTTDNEITITAKTAASNVTINGTLDLLDEAGTTVAGLVTNNGTIKSKATSNAIQKTLVTLGGSGTVVLSGTATAIDTAKLTLRQHIEIVSGGKVVAPVVATPFDGGKTITITGTGVLDFGTAAVTAIGAKVENYGTAAGAIATATTSDAALGVIMGAGGKITASGTITALSQALTVPSDVDLTASGPTFVTGNQPVTVNGTAVFDLAEFAQVTTSKISVNGSAEFTVADFANLTGTAGATIFEVGPKGNAVFTAATFATTTVGDIVVNGAASLEDNAVPGGNVLVGGSLTIAAGKGLTIAGGKNLLVKNGASLGLDGSDGVVLKGATPAGAKLTLGNGATGKNTVIAVANAVSTTNEVSDATITAALAVVTITVTQAGTGGTSVDGASVAAATSTDATITIGVNKTTNEVNTPTFATATAVALHSSGVVPQGAGFGAGVAIATGVITVDAINGAVGSAP
jgi:hypothetical protein